MRWLVHSEQIRYDRPWLSVRMADVEAPGIRRFEHHLVRTPEIAGTVVSDPAKGVLMLWRHRFITDSWGWEVPAGKVEPGESPEMAAAREVLEETGWRPGALSPVTSYHPMSCLCDTNVHLFAADGATYVGSPQHPEESERVAWLSAAELQQALADGKLRDGISLTALLCATTLTPK